MRVYWTIFSQDIIMAWRLGNISLAVAFLFIAVTLLPFGVGPELALLKRLAPGLLWVILILTMLLSLDRLFQSDLEDGSFDQLLLLEHSFELVILTKIFAHYVAILVPVAIFLPIAGLMLNIDASTLPGLALSVLLAGPALSALGAIGAALSASVQRSGLLTALIVMPLYVPILIFGASVIGEASAGINWPALGILAAISLATAMLSPFAVAASLRGAER
jgi:heme exporter protein B